MTSTRTPVIAEKSRLRIAIVGHVDHGKSTVLGRLMFDTKQVPEDRIAKVQKMCEEQGKQLEYAFLLDALEEEQRQGITIDVSQFYWQSDVRQVAFIDAPGHKEFLKNMVSGASAVDAALLVIDANEGVSEQSRRHGYILHFLGVEHVIVVVNKMDLVGYSEATFKAIEAEYTEFLGTLGVKAKVIMPVSGLKGQNISSPSPQMPWFAGQPLSTLLEELQLTAREDKDLRFVIQDVYKWDERRILGGRIEAGRVRVGDEMLFLPSKKRGIVAGIEKWAAKEQPSEAVAGESVGIRLKDQIFVERGEIGSHVDEAPKLANRVKANVYWLGDEPLAEGNAYRLKLGTQAVDCMVERIVKVLNTEKLDYTDGKPVEKNEVGEVIFSLRQNLAFDNFSEIKYTGRFVISQGEAVMGGGVVDDAHYPDLSHIVDRTPVSQNIFLSEAAVTSKERAEKQGYPGTVIWMTGLSGSGKTTIARGLSRALFDQNLTPFVLDGDNLRHGLNADLGFSPDDRAENMRRVAEVAKLMADAGQIVISALISPYRSARDFARRLIPEHFVEVFVDAPIEVCEERDVKGLYAKARNNEIEMTGISASAPFEAPKKAEVHVRTDQLDEKGCVNAILEALRSKDVPVSLIE